MRRLIRRRKRLTALSLMLAMAAFIVTLPGWQWFEPTAQGRGQTAPAQITILSTEARIGTTADVIPRHGIQGVVDKQDTGDVTWATSFDKSPSVRADLNGASATANGDLHASLAVNGDQLQYIASLSGTGIFAIGSCVPCEGRGSVDNAHLRVSFTVTRRSMYSFTGSVSVGGGDGNAISGVSFGGGPIGGTETEVAEQFVVSNTFNQPPQNLPFSKSGIMDPGEYDVDLDGAMFSDGSNNSVAGNVTLTIGPSSVHEFHWVHPTSEDFATLSNWNPALVPGVGDTAIFDLPSTAPIAVTAQNVSVASLLDHGMDLELHGSMNVLTGPSPQLGFAVDSGGQLLLNNGATLATQDGSVSGPFGSTVFVNGSGTQWTIGPSGELDIGFPGKGEVVVVNDGSLNAQKSIKVGDINAQPSSLRVELGGQVQTPSCTIEKGSVQVSGEGANDSKLEVASDLKVGGQNGPGSMLVEGGGTVHAQEVTVGDAAGNGRDTITISGVDSIGLPSSLSVNGPSPHLAVAGGAGTQVEVKDGGLLKVDTSGSAIIGSKFDVGKVIVHGKAGNRPATWDTFGDIFIGGEIVPSELIVMDGGRVRSTGHIFVGTNANQGLGRIEVSGTDSLLSADTLSVGLNGKGELKIDEGGQVQSAAGSVGESIGAAAGSGSVTITGRLLFPSEWHVTGDCFVGSNEPGSVVLNSTSILPFSAGAATLRVDGTLMVGTQGLISGNGTLAASHVINHGFISPGLSPGIIVIEGDYQQASDGVLRMEAAGLNDGQFDVLHVTGGTSLGGTLDVRFLNGYSPKTGDVIPFLKLDGAVTGSFAQIIFPQLAPGFQFKTEIVNGSFKLTALNDAVLAPTGSVQFSASNYNVTEGCVAVQLTVTRTGNNSDQITVDFATSDSGAQQRTDYAIASGTVTLAAGETSKSFPILIADDNYQEPGEQLSVTLSNPTGNATLGAPSMAAITILDDDTAPPTANVIDETGDFVAQHYHDFLSREPDPGGFAFWTSQINQCGSDQTCVRAKRIDVSNAFYFELEFQQTGSYVYRLYRAAFGNNQPFPNPDNSNQLEANKIPSYAVLMPDRARVPGGLSLPQEQLDLATAFVQRPAFILKYPASLDGSSFIDAVLNTIKNDMGADLTAQKPGLLTLFNAGGRGAVMYRLADDNAPTNPIDNRAFIDAEYNRAFVATQYFGYLRRDADIGGFLFWLGQVNSAPLRSLSRQHAMVCSFITAAEYQNRFSSIVSHNNGECGQ